MQIVVSTNSTKRNTNGSTSSNDTTVLIPLVLDSTQFVNSFIACSVSDTVSFKLFRGREYAQYGYDYVSTKPNAGNIALQCIEFEHQIFKHDTIALLDKKLSMTISGTGKYFPFLRFKPKSVSSGGNVAPDLMRLILYNCGDMELMPYYDPNGVAPGEDLHYQDVGLNNCSSIWIDDSNGGYQGGGGSWYSPPSTGGSGTPSYPNNLGWGAVDANGFLLSRLVELQGILDIDPFAITPCDSANIMPLDDVTGYGAMYKRVAQFQIPGNVRSRIDSVNNVAPTSWLDDFYVQEIWKASGSVVNCDYFPIRIKQLPAGMQAGDLTEYFRLHINQFIDASIGVQFLPYTDGNFNDVAKFNSPFEQSVGSIIHLKLPFNDGTIVESDYYKDFTPGREIHRFQVSTVTSPLDHNHPVSGNRVFGVYSDQNRPGEFVFYIMGVDRTSDWKFALLNVRSTGFDMSDKLWQNVQQNMISYINSLPGGNAVYYTPAQVVARPHWDDVKNYLMGYITFEQLKTKLGC